MIARELCDTELDAHTLGRQLGISARYVQMVLARRGTSKRLAPVALTP